MVTILTFDLKWISTQKICRWFAGKCDDFCVEARHINSAYLLCRGRAGEMREEESFPAKGSRPGTFLSHLLALE